MRSPGPHEIIREAALPPAITRRIRRLVRLTHLRRHERALIAATLCTDANERLAEGESEREVLRGLRRPRRQARAIRGAVLRESSLGRQCLWRMRTWFVRSFATGLLVLAVTYPYLFWRFHAARPTLTRNFSAEHNAWIDSLPSEECAAELYREANRALERLEDEGPDTFGREWHAARPGTRHWPEARAYIERNQHAIELIHRAAARPHAGFRLSFDSQMEPGSVRPPVSQRDATNPPRLDLSIDSLGVYRRFARVLALDARIADVQGDPARWAADLDSMFRLAIHAEETGVIIADLVALAIRALAIDALGSSLESESLGYGPIELSMLAQCLHDSAQPGASKVILEGERQTLLDLTQRIFTDDGNGDGWLCADGLRHMKSVTQSTNRLDPVTWVLGPLALRVYASRREFVNEWEIMLAAVEMDASPPLWVWQELPGSDYMRQRLYGQRIKPPLQAVGILVPVIGKAALAHETYLQSRDAALVLIALIRYRLDNGHYPEALDELVQDYLDAIPPDRFDGTPIKYRITDDGTPILYSVGRNRRDDGGVPTDSLDDGTASMRWAAPHEAGRFGPGDWIILPRQRAEISNESE